MKLHCKTNIAKSSALLLIFALFFAAVSPQIAQAQAKRLFGELTVIKTVPAATGFVTVDGLRAESGRTLVSPSSIMTPPDATAKIALAQTGTATLAPNSSFSLTFVDGSIAGDLTTGEITLETVPGTTLNIFTRDGAISTPNRSEKNTIKISVENGATRVTVVDGQAMFNKVLISAGETFPTSTSGGAGAASPHGINPLIFAAIGGAIAAAVIIALTVSNGDNNPVVSATQ